MARVYDNGSSYTVQLTAGEVGAFASRWPGYDGPEQLTVQFEKRSGDLVDIQPEDADPPEALIDHAACHGAAKLGLDSDACARVDRQTHRKMGLRLPKGAVGADLLRGRRGLSGLASPPRDHNVMAQMAYERSREFAVMAEQSARDARKCSLAFTQLEESREFLGKANAHAKAGTEGRGMHRTNEYVKAVEMFKRLCLRR